jgi:hypothetical protein
MTRPYIAVKVESKWAAYVSGRGSWQLCRDAGRRKPQWSRTERAWVVSESTARKVLELAEQIDGLGVVVAGPRQGGERASALASSEADEQDALW